ncbi:MAG: glutamate--cysteine ligase [Gammaproteobacteria bacterium]|nr:glutamate--cysteine ligase [Gammaproteobacteria bacterium]MDX5374206.1 glutamate--cysteine ligase [Gammaproteobacteria bacterium]
MGQEIDSSDFTPADFAAFHARLVSETETLQRWEAEGRLSSRGPVAGFEIEAWLIDRDARPAPRNEAFLAASDDQLTSPELARFNVELNNRPQPLCGRAFSLLEAEIAQTWEHASEIAEAIGTRLVMTGILPTVTAADLSMANMSNLNRYRALNAQVFRQREHRPLRLDIAGHEHLRCEHHDVMLESATTSFQLHLQTPIEQAVRVYNTAMRVSAPMVAIAANSPYLFGHELWEETRIPLFEQAVEIGGYAGVTRGPLWRVGFGSGYARHSILECFRENLEHYPVLLPMALADDGTLPHLRLHNGTIWRWNRPLLGFDEDGRPHIRIEHRVMPAGPTVVDQVANAAFFYGLVQALAADDMEARLPFARARDNFYAAARRGLAATIRWDDDRHVPIRELILHTLLPAAREGLRQLAIAPDDIARYLDIIQARAETTQNGAEWQRRWVTVHGRDMARLTEDYLRRQWQGRPVHEWDL